MPLSEFHRATRKGKPESNQPKMHNCSSDVSSFMPDPDFDELLWENGQTVMQSQSNRPKKSSFLTPFPSLKFQGKESQDDAGMPKIGLFEAMNSTINASSLSVTVPSANVDLHAQDDEMAPWINYSVEDSLCSEFFSELSGINPNSLPNDRNNGFGVKDFHNVEHGQSNKGFREGQEQSRTRTSQFFQLPQQCQTSSPNSKPKLADFSVPGGSLSSIDPQSQFQKQELVSASKPSQQRGGGVASMNFSHFARPVARTNANIEHRDRWKSKEEALSPAASTNPMDSTLIESTRVRGNSVMDLANKELKSAAKPHCVSVGKPDAFVLEGASRNNQHCIGTVKNNSATDVNRHNSSIAVNVALGSHGAEKGPEPIVASSVCSGNSAGAASSDPKHREKRKNRGGDEFEYLSEDLEDNSIGEKKLTTARAGTSTKRSRAAQVHNLSERRRRDRINEKMRALQELIPNCNKVDKASMLDEAIEYLKTLQLQVQMMSMGTGLCMPPLMLPPGMAHFSPMGLGMGMGMGMGMGYGMGMFDMNGSPGFIPVPSMHAPQYPCTSISGATGLHGIPGSTGLQLFGIPGHGQGHPMSMPRAQLFSPLPDSVAKGNATSEVSGMMVHSMPVSDAGLSSSSKDQQQQQQNMNLDAVQKTNISESQVAKESLERSNLVQMSNQALQSGNKAVNSTSDRGNTPSRRTSFG